MPRAPTTPRLPDLEPVAIATEVVDLVAAHLERLALRLGEPPARRDGSPSLRLDLRWTDGPASCDLGVTVQDLVRWAQAGEGDATEAWEAVLPVCEALYSQAGVPGFGAGALDEPGDPTTPIGVVLLAASARHEIAQGSPVSPRALAALAGMSKRWVNNLAEAGEVKRGAGGGISPHQAARLLASRVVGADDARALERAHARVRYACGGGRAWLVVHGDVATAALATARGWARQGEGWVARGVA